MAAAETLRSLPEVLSGLRQNPLFRHLLGHLVARRDARIEVAIKARDDVDTLRGRAQEMMDLIRDLEKE